MKIKTNVKAGLTPIIIDELVVHVNVEPGKYNHNQTITRGLKDKSGVKAGGQGQQRNQTIARSLKLKSGVKAGTIVIEE